MNCPKCGHDAGMWIRVPVYGYRTYFIDADGEKTFANDDALQERAEPKTGECARL